MSDGNAYLEVIKKKLDAGRRQWKRGAKVLAANGLAVVLPIDAHRGPYLPASRDGHLCRFLGIYGAWKRPVDFRPATETLSFLLHAEPFRGPS